MILVTGGDWNTTVLQSPLECPSAPTAREFVAAQTTNHSQWLYESKPVIENGILSYDGNIEDIPPKYHGDWVNEIYSDFNAIVIELRK